MKNQNHKPPLPPTEDESGQVVDEAKPDEHSDDFVSSMSRSELRRFILSVFRKNKEKDVDEDPLLNKTKHQNKRRMAWICLFSMIAFAIFLFIKIDPENIQHYEIVIMWIMSTFSLVILGYMGVSTWNANVFEKERRNSHRRRKGRGHDHDYDDYEDDYVGGAHG